MGIVGEKKTYVDTYKELHDKYVAVKVRRFQEHWSRSIELFRAKEEVMKATVIDCIFNWPNKMHEYAVFRMRFSEKNSANLS